MKAKKLFFNSCFVLLLFSASAQDTLQYVNNEKCVVKVVEISSDVVVYKRSGNLSGPTYSEYKSKIKCISYANGTKDFFSIPLSDMPFSSAIKKNEVVPARVKFSGPRVGLTVMSSGTVSDYITNQGKSPVVSQFGWQFETRLFTLENGASGVVEFVPLIGGLEQGLFLPSASCLVGLRGGEKKRIEFALGPNVSITGVGVVFAIGTSFRVGNIYFPVNLAYLPSVSNKINETGHRFSLMIGFNMQKK